MAKESFTGCLHRAICRDRKGQGIPQLSWDCLCKETCSTRIRRIFRESQELQEIQKTRKTEGRILPHLFNVSPDCVPHMEKVFSIVRQTYGRSPTDDLNDLDVNRYVVYIYVCHSSSCSSCWWRLHRKSAIYQESTLSL